MNAIEKYELLRPCISDGDLILFRGTRLIAKIIQFSDESYFNHIGIVFKRHGALFIVDANGNGVQADRLSYRIKKYKNGDFLIIKPKVSKVLQELEMQNLLMRSDPETIKYDFKNGIIELINRVFNFDFRIKQNDSRDICSDFVSRYAINLEIMYSEFNDLQIPLPQDYLRYINLNKVEIIGGRK